MRADLKQHWPAVMQALQHIEVAPLEVPLKRTSTQVKYRLWARSLTGRRVHIGRPHETEARARQTASLEQRVVVDEKVRNCSARLRLISFFRLCWCSLCEPSDKNRISQLDFVSRCVVAVSHCISALVVAPSLCLTMY